MYRCFLWLPSGNGMPNLFMGLTKPRTYTESVHQVLFLNFSQGQGTNSWTRVMTILLTREVGLMDASKREESLAGKMDTAIQH